MRNSLLIGLITSIFIFPTVIFAQIILPPIHGPIVEKITIFVPDLSSLGGSDQKAKEFIQVVLI